MLTLASARPHPLLARRLFGLLPLALAARRQRARLAQLDDHLLSDIGLSRDDARAEAARAPWDVPAHWRNG